ncbi:MAG: M48 family metalloprotease [Bosea sp. (in: a-proteobacteria)]
MFRVNGFYGHVRRNNMLSVALFGGFLIGFHVAAVAVLLLPLMMFDPTRAPMPDPLAYVASYGISITLLAALLFVVLYRRQVKWAQAATGFNFVSDKDAPRLHRIAGPLALAAGIPEPRLGVMPIAACNAFACGHSPATSAIVVTQGLLDALNDVELQAVIAHEITHIVNRDTRLLAAANIMLSGVERIERHNPFRITSAKRLILFIILPILLVPALIIGMIVQIGALLARISRFAISSAREFVADAEAVRLTHDPAALISALVKIEGRSAIPGLGAGMDAMMIHGAETGGLATHPTLAERVGVLQRLSGALSTPRVGQAAAVPFSKPRQSMTQRVRAGSNRNFLGLTPRMTLAVVAVFVGFQVYSQIGFNMAKNAMGGAAQPAAPTSEIALRPTIIPEPAR